MDHTPRRAIVSRRTGLAVLAALLATLYMPGPGPALAAVVSLQGSLPVSADTVGSGLFGSLTINPQVVQTSAEEWPAGTTLTIRAPANFEFNTAAGVTATLQSNDPTFDLGGGPGLNATVIVAPTLDTIQFIVVASGSTKASSIGLSGIELRAANCTGATAGDAADVLISASAGDLIDASLVDVSVVPGALDHYSLQAGPATQTAASPITFTLRAEDACSNGIPLLAVPADISVSATGGAAILSFAGGTLSLVDTDANDNAAVIPAAGNAFKAGGRGTFLVTSPALDGPVTLTINDGVRMANVVVNWITSRCAVSPESNISEVSRMHSVRVTVERNGQPASGVNVEFAVSSGPNFGAATSGATDANGEFEFSYTSNGTPGIDMIGASGAIDGIPFSCTASQEWIDVLCDLTPATSSGPTGAMHTVTSTAVRNGVPVGGLMIEFAIPTGPNSGQSASMLTDTNGQAVFAYQSNGVAGEDTITASGVIDGVALECSATRLWVQSSCLLEPASATVAVGGMHMVMVTLQRSGQPAMDVPVHFEVIGSGSPNLGAMSDATTNAAGQAAFMYTSNGAAGVDLIEASGTLDASPFACTATVTWAAPSCSLTPPTATSQIGTPHTVRATVSRNGAPADGVLVNFSITNGPNVGQTGSGMTDANGQIDFMYTGGAMIGTDTIEASGSIDGLPFSCMAQKTWVNVRCTLSPLASVGAVGGMHTVAVSVQRNSSSVAGVGVLFEVISGPNMGSTGSGTTNGFGLTGFTYTSNGTGGLDTIRASGMVDGVPFNCTATREWISPTCSLEPATGSGPVGATYVGTVTVFRRPGVPLFPATVNFVVTAGPNTGQLQAGVATNEQGQATFTYVGSGGPGTDTIESSGTINGVAYMCTGTQEWAQAGCSLSPPTATRRIGTTHQVDLELRQNGVAVPNTPVTFQVSGVNASVPPGMGTTDAEGRASFSYQSNGLPGMDTIAAMPMLSSGPASCTAAVTWLDAQCSLMPATSTNLVGTPHSVTLTVTRDGLPAANVAVGFLVIGSSSPNAGMSGNDVTNGPGQAIFTYTGTGGVGTDTIQASGAIDGIPFACTATKQWIQSSCEIAPATSSGPINTEHLFTVSVSRSGSPAGAGVPVRFEIVSGPNTRPLSAPRNTDAEGRVMFTYLGGGGTGTDTIRTIATVDAVDTICTATRTWISTACSLAPASSTNLVGTTHTVTTTLLSNGAPAAGVLVSFAVVGAGSPNIGRSGMGTTNGLGQAAFTYLGSGGIGTDTIQASGSVAGIAFNCTATKTWINTACVLTPAVGVHRVGTTQSAVLTLMRNGAPAANVAVSFAVIGTGAPNAGVTGSATTNSGGQATFSYAGAGGLGTDTIRASGAIDGVPFSCTASKQWVDVSCAITPAASTNQVGTAHSVNCTLTRGLSPAGGVAVNFEVVSGPNLGRSGMGTTNTAGLAVFTYTGSGGIGTDQIRASGMVDGAVPFECTATKTWTDLRCVLSPATQTNLISTTHVLTITLTRDGAPVAGVPVQFKVASGPNAGVMGTRSTTASGQATFAYSGKAMTGTDIITVSGTTGGVSFSCTATKRWITSSCTLLPASQSVLAGQAARVTFTLLIDGAAAPAGVGVIFEVTSGPHAGQSASAVTDASGKASFTYIGSTTAGTDTIRASGAFEGVPFNCTASVTWAADDADGVPPSMENEGPNNGDGNNDGVPDSMQPNVASMTDVFGSYFTVETPAGSQLESVEAMSAVSAGSTPPNTSFPNGLLRFEISGLAPGGAADVRLFLYGGGGANAYYKFGPTPTIPVDHYHRFTFDGTTGAEVAGNEIVLHLVDGGRGDDDLTANGIIIEPGAPAFESQPPPTPSPAPSAGCGACGAGAATFIPLSMLGVGLLGRMRRVRIPA